MLSEDWFSHYHLYLYTDRKHLLFEAVGYRKQNKRKFEAGLADFCAGTNVLT